MERGRVAYVALLSSAAQSETVITVNQGLRGGKIIELKKTVDQAVKQCPGVKRVLVSMRTTSKVPMTALDVPLEEVRGCPAILPFLLGKVLALGAGTLSGERILPGHGSFTGIDRIWGRCPAAAAAARTAHKFRTVPVAIRMGNWCVFPYYQPCTTVKGRQCKPEHIAGWTAA